MNMDTMIGIIGGSGLYDIEGLTDAKWVSVETPWGAPSDQVFTGTLAPIEPANMIKNYMSARSVEITKEKLKKDRTVVELPRQVVVGFLLSEFFEQMDPACFADD